MSDTEVLDLYRFRWQVELAFKRLKSLLHIDELPAKDHSLTRTFIYAKLLAALLLEDLSDRFLVFSPWGYPLV
ncbi:MAG: transposase [Deltaproteobacteria bacterium]|nr:transposase [Deltaproteobacteria bacterium]